ncbi:Regulator of telomere elongation helicase 1 [Durusdinium trenchii]
MDDVDRALEFEEMAGGFFSPEDDVDEGLLLEAALRAEQEQSQSRAAAAKEDPVGTKRSRPSVSSSHEGPTEGSLPSQIDRMHQTQTQQAHSQTPVDILAERIQALSLAESSGCIRGPGLISGHPCPIMPDHVRCRFEVGGVEVLFPFAQPLDPQKAVIKSVLEALSLNKHAVLESPTGTGKTAAVLCAALAWQRHRMSKSGTAPQIMYATRTHAQVRQAMKELERTPYRPVVAALGSREAGLCVNSQVLESADNEGQIRQACRQARQQKSCQFHSGLLSSELPRLAFSKLRGNEIWDIEDAAEFSLATNSCPYYLAHSLAKHAELVFCPYSYILDPSVRQAAGLSCADLTSRVVILDEAHNVESVCRDAGSAELNLDQLKAALSAVKRVLGEDSGQVSRVASIPAPVTSQKSTPVEELGGFFLPATVTEASEKPKGPKLVPKTRSQGLLNAVRPLAGLLQRVCNFISDVREPITYAPHLPDHQRVPALLRILKLDSEPLLRFNQPGAGRSRNEGNMPRAEALLRELVGRGLSGSFSAQLELAASLFGQLGAAVRRPDLYVARAHPGGQGQQAHLHLWLMSAEGTLGTLCMELHALVLMSGTLSPLPTTIAELGPTFHSNALLPVAANHVVGPEALRVVTVAQQAASTSSKLECTFHAWKRLPFLLSIGHALVKIVKAIPAGVLVFLPSYDLLERCLEAWQKTDNDDKLLSCETVRRKGRGKGGRQGTKRRYRGAVERVEELPETTVESGRSIMDELRAAKGTIVLEPPPMCQTSTATVARVYQAAKDRYEKAVMQSGQAALLAVYRGRMSEGVSFDDDFARGVICIGIPFPNLTEERLAQKRACNDFWLAQRLGVVSGDAWYESKALHAVAQALGRCIRHPHDFGALVLLDSRWSELGKSSQLPLWLQPFVVHENDAEDAALLLQEHFAHHVEALPRTGCPQVKCDKVETKGEKCDAKDETKDEIKDELKDEIKDEIKEELHDVNSPGCFGAVAAKWLDTTETRQGPPATPAHSPPQPIFQTLTRNTEGVYLDLDSD